MQGLQLLDMDAVKVPEMDALLGRWAKDIETIVADLDDRDAVAKLELMKVRESFEQFELQP